MVKIYREVYCDILWFHATSIVCGDAVLSHFHSDDSESAFFVGRRRKIFFWLVFFPCSWPQSRSSYCRTWIRRHRWDCNRSYFDRLDHDRFILLLLQLLRDHLLLSPGHMRRRRRSEGRKGRLWVWLLDCLISLPFPRHRFGGMRVKMKAGYGLTGLLINTMMQLFQRERDGERD